MNLPKKYLQGISNILTIWKPIRRPRKQLIPIIKLLLQEKLNNFKIVIFLQILEGLTEPTNISIKLSAKTPEPEKPANTLENYNKTPGQDISLEQLAIVSKTPVINLYNLQKYNYNQIDKPDKPNKRIAKQARAMLALLE